MLGRLFYISRPVLWINTVGPAVVGMWLAGSLWSLAALPILLWLTLPFNLLIYGVNDIFDRDTDAANPRKGSLEGARISERDVGRIRLGVLATNLPFLAYFFFGVGASAFLWMLAYAAIFVAYSAPPARFKARPFLDSLSNAAYAFPLVFVPLALGAQTLWPAALGLMAWSAAKHTFDAVQDIEEDRRSGIRTTAVALGPRGAALYSGTLWVASVAGFALVSLPVALVCAAFSGLLVLALYRRPSPRTGRRMYRLSIAYPYVAGTTAGVQLVAALSLGLYP